MNLIKIKTSGSIQTAGVHFRLFRYEEIESTLLHFKLGGTVN